jgi:hypothetical protein
MVGGLMRSGMAAQIDGGLGFIISKVLHRIYGDVGMAVAGVHLPTREANAQMIVFIDFSVLLSDGAAWSNILSCKAAGGIRPCPFCANVIQETHGDSLMRLGGGAFVPLGCTDPSKFVRQTDADVYETVDELARIAATGTKAALDRAEKAFGWNHTPNGLLLDASLRPHVKPLTNTMFDWQHIWLVDGISSDELSLCPSEATLFTIAPTRRFQW